MIEKIIPHRLREEILKDSPSAGSVLSSAPSCVFRQIQETFRFNLAAGQASILYVAFLASSLSTSIITIWIMLGVALTVLTVRDAYLNTEVYRPRQFAIADGVIVATFLFVAWILLREFQPDLGIPAGALVRGAAIGLLLIATLRSLVRMPRWSGAQHLWTWRMHVLWIVACLIEVFTNPDPVEPGSFILLVVPLAATGLMAALEKHGSVDQRIDLKLDPNSRPTTITHRLTPEEMFFVFLLLVPTSMVFADCVRSGFNPGGPGFLRAWVNVVVLVMMSAVWIHVWRDRKSSADS